MLSSKFIMSVSFLLEEKDSKILRTDCEEEKTQSHSVEGNHAQAVSKHFSWFTSKLRERS